MPSWMRQFFKVLNKFFMVPFFRLGFGPIMCNPVTGYMMVMKVIGRKTGKVRYTPVNYAIWKGNIYCISGGRKSSDWYKNLCSHPDIEVILPGGAIYGHVEEDNTSGDRLCIIRQVLKNAGFAGFFEGYNPYTIDEAEFEIKTQNLPVFKIQPIGIGNGASDPQGWAGVWALIGTALLILLLVLD